MNYVYVDNYRGFSSTLIPVKQVNFLVGENSTGKTSLLALMKILSPHEFWLRNELNIREVGLGTFNDVVSISSSDRSYFTVGMLFDLPTKKPKRTKLRESPDDGPNDIRPNIVAFAMTFVEHEGVPKLDSFISYRNGLEVRARYTRQQIRYRCAAKTIDQTSDKFAEESFAEWAKSVRKDSSGYSVLKGPSMFLRNAPPIVALAHIEDQVAGTLVDGDSIQLEISSFLSDMAWLAPIRTRPRKTYDEYSLEFSAEGEHIPYLIKKTLASKNESGKFRAFLKETGSRSGLFEDVHIKNYGRTATSPFELDVVLNDDHLSISNVGYGVSQALPIIVEMFSRRQQSWIAIQQPEVHVHPRAQAALGQMIFELAEKDQKQFLVETHSDFAIDRFRITLRKSAKKVDAQILFFERTSSGNEVTPIPIDVDGSLPEDQPSSYREFFLREEMELLGL